ncbi:metal-dependent transcriptional regulator [Candidatus Sumerlaeota bacterium]|nr:metal-dependent transcriptional regulator [Candidatus Sumerlaeota bacterium]
MGSARTQHQAKTEKSGKPFELTHAMREYLQTAYRLEIKGNELTVTALADAQHVVPASATAMVKKLTSLGLMTHSHYGAVELTEEGRLHALLAVRRHRLLECFLVRVMRYGLDEVHDESENLEPVISDRFERKIDEVLGYPARCPHGDPIPDLNGTIRDGNLGFPLSELEEGRNATILRVPGSKPQLLRYLLDLGIEPEKPVQLVKREPFGGPLHLKLGRKTILLGPEAAQSVYVTKAETSALSAN